MSVRPGLAGATAVEVRFVDEAAPGGALLLRFADPRPCTAILLPGSDTDAAREKTSDLRVTFLPANAESDMEAWRSGTGDFGTGPLLRVKQRGVELLWRRGEAVLSCEESLRESLLLALVEFSYFERELHTLEREAAGAWTDLERDKHVAFQATAADLRNSEQFCARMTTAFDRRIRFARTEPHLHLPNTEFSAAARGLGEALREQADIESRAEFVDSQLSVAEHIYEMGSQRLGEFRASHGEHIMELIIIALLAAETLAMLAQIVFQHHS